MFSNRKIILIIVLLLTFSFAAYFIVVIIPARLAEKTYEGAKQIGRDFREAFQFTPEVTVNNTIVLQQQAPILELATLSQKFQHHYVWTNTWLGSKKKIDITGTFEAKAGFDLNKKFKIDIAEDKAVVTLPNPQLLSVEGLSDITFRDEQGLWNWVNGQDRAAAVNAFTADARKYAAQASFVGQAQKSVEDKIRAILKTHGKEVEIRYTDNPGILFNR